MAITMTSRLVKNNDFLLKSTGTQHVKIDHMIAPILTLFFLFSSLILFISMIVKIQKILLNSLTSNFSMENIIINLLVYYTI